MLHIAVPLDTTWLGFFVAVLLLTIFTTIYLQARRLISSSQALVAVFTFLGGSAIAYLAIYGMGFEQIETTLFFFVNRPASSDWFSLATILANCVIAIWVIYAWSVQQIDAKRAVVYVAFPMIISCYLVFFWYRLGSPLTIALPSWVRFPARPDWFNFLVELLCGIALFKAIVDRLKGRTSTKYLLLRVSATLAVTALLIVGWYGLARDLVMSTVPDWLVILLSAISTPPVLVEMFTHHKRRRFRISAFAVLNSAFIIMVTAQLLVTNLPGVLAWELAEYSHAHQNCDLAEPLYKLVMRWNPQWRQAQQHLAACTARLSSAPGGNQPKQHKIAFLSNRDGHSRVYVMNADGSDQQALTGNGIGEAVFPAAWSPDGQQLAFTTQHNGSWEIYTMNADGSHLQLLTSSNVLAGVSVWLPDGKHIAFSSVRTGHYQTYIMDTSGSNIHPFLPTDNDEDVTWSPDEKYVVMTLSEGTREKWSHLYVANSEGAVNYRLPDGGFTSYQPGWSPDGQQIAFTQINTGYNIMLINVDGTGLHTLTSGLSISGAASWSPDGQQITFESNHSGHWAIYVINKDGKNLRCLTRTLFDSGSPTWQP